MKVCPKNNYMPKALHKRLLAEEFDVMLFAVKAKLGKASSVTHLGHATIAIITLKCTPISYITDRLHGRIVCIGTWQTSHQSLR